MIQAITLNERHFSVKDVATMWGLSPAAIRRMFRNEPGVLRFGKEKHGHQRDCVTLRIPENIAERVYRRCMRPGLVSPLAGDTRKGRA